MAAAARFRLVALLGVILMAPVESAWIGLPVWQASADLARGAECGNGFIEDDEQCDDGNTVSNYGCSATCTREVCGDGVINLPGETCDPPGLPAGLPNECRGSCTFCGDGVPNDPRFEACDDGNNVAGDGCDACDPYCRFPCGNGIVDPGTDETCDPPGEPVGLPNECRDSCTFCGDGIPDETDLEVCDDGNNVAGDGCDPDCQSEAICGNGTVDPFSNETCDPPGLPAGLPNECRGDCTFCGDGVANDPRFEFCDDGNNVDGDGCDRNCLPESSCGDRIVDASLGETCDPPELSTAGPDYCRADCRFCGDGRADGPEVEECDDGNNSNGDGCDRFCKFERSPTCGDGIVDRELGETCDSRGLDCRADCTRCGDGVLDGQHNEACDDGNNRGNDGCNPNCQFEVLESCGDGTVQSQLGETCDPPGSVAGPWNNPCRNNCTYCGDRQVDLREQCDRNDFLCTDTCRVCARCQLTAGSAVVDGNWKELPLRWFMDDPVIIAGPATQRGSDRGLVRVRGVHSHGFSARFQEWSHLDGNHEAQEHFDFLALPSGTHTMRDGSIWIAGTFELDNAGTVTRVELPTSTTTPPKLFLSLQTDRNNLAVTPRVLAVDGAGFSASLLAHEGATQRPGREKVGYLAIRSPRNAGTLWVNVPRGSEIQTVDSEVLPPYRIETFEADEQWAPFLTWQVRLAEERSADAELTHEPELVNALAIDDKFLLTQIVSNRESDPARVERAGPGRQLGLTWGVMRGLGREFTALTGFDRPAFVAIKPLLSTDADPMVPIMVTTPGYLHVALRKWRYLEADDATAQASFLASAPGRHRVGELDYEAGQRRGGAFGAFTRVRFLQSFPEPPAVFAGLDIRTPAVPRIRNVTREGFEFAVHQEEGQGRGVRGLVYWIAIEKGQAVTRDGRRFDVLSVELDHNPAWVGFPVAVDRRFATVVAEINSYNGTDPVFPRLVEVEPGRARLFLQEEQSLDEETEHRKEQVAIFVGN